MLAAAPASVPGWHSDALAGALPLERDQFVELSEKLCAMSIDDRVLADAIQNASPRARRSRKKRGREPLRPRATKGAIITGE